MCLSFISENQKKIIFKVPISWWGILDIHNIWNRVIRIAIYLVVC